MIMRTARQEFAVHRRGGNEEYFVVDLPGRIPELYTEETLRASLVPTEGSEVRPVFMADQFVIVDVPELGGPGQLGNIGRLVPMTGTGYEITMLRDHRPGDGFDLVRCVGARDMRLATEEEIRTKVGEWEEAHNHKLNFRIVPLGAGLAIASA